MNFTDPQREAINERRCAVALVAGAGSGKTGTLVARYIELLREGVHPRNIAAITFTEKAAAEMEERVRTEVGRRLAKEGGIWEAVWKGLGQAQISTIDSFCARLLRLYPLEADVTPGFDILDPASAARLMRPAAERAVREAHTVGDMLVDRLITEKDLLDGAVSTVLRMLTEARRFGPAAEAVEAMLDKANAIDGEAREIMQCAARLVEATEQYYSAAKLSARALDFPDLILHALTLFYNRGAAGEIREEYRAVMVDEVQDTSPLQIRLVEALVGQAGSQKLFIVGDPKQSIYHFRGADVRGFTRLVRQIEREHGRRLNLDTNFRTEPDLLRLVCGCFTGAKLGMPSEDVNLNPGRKPGPPGIRAENWRLTEEKAPKRAEEDAALVAARIRELVESAAPTVCEPGPDDEDKWRPAKFGDIALLLRNRTHLSNFIEAFRRAGIPYAVTAGNALMDSRAVQDLIQALHLVNTPADSFHAAAFLRSSLTGISDDTLYLLASRCEGNLGKAFLELRPDDDTLVGEGMAAADASILVKARRLLDRWLLLRGRTSPAELCRQIVLDTSFPEYLLLDSRGEQELANVDAFLDLLETAPQLSLPSCLHQLAEGLLGGEESEADIDAGGANVVQIMTIHAAKGLQFPIVILADNAQSLKKGSVSAFLYERDPDGGYKAGLALGTGAGRAEIADYRELSDAEAKASRDEEQRLLYVALTRAKDRLIITTPPPETQKIDQEWVETLALLTPPQFRKTRVVEAVAPSLPIFLDYPENAEPWQAQAVSPGRSAVSPSAIQSYNDCPRAYYLQYRLRLSIRQDAMENERFTDAPDGPAGSSVVNRDRALALGTAVHAAIEGIILGKDTAAVLAERTAERVVDSAEVRTLTEAFVRVFKPAGSVSAEKDFAVPLAPGLDLRGQIDYLEHLPGGGYRIWDYKTNRVEDQDLEALVEHYAVQVRLYAWAVAQETGEPVKEAALLFLRRNQLVPIPVEDRTVAANTAAAVASALKMRDGRAPVDFPRNRDHCPKCPLRAFCG